MFQRALAELDAMSWRSGVAIEEIGSPQRIAPHSIAISAEFTDPTTDQILATGRLILLHDPVGNDAWHGAFRVVSFARADVDPEMAADPLLPEAAWTWMTDALHHHDAHHVALAGTVTASHGKSFGEMAGTEDQADVEIRSSWTPRLGDADPFTGHLKAWQDLLGHVGGQPPLPSGVVHFPGRA